MYSQAWIWKKANRATGAGTSEAIAYPRTNQAAI